MAKVTVYQVWSRRLPFAEHPPVLHGVCTAWNLPGTEDGAVQLKDKVSERFYRLGEAVRRRNAEAYRKDLPIEPDINVHVSIKAIELEIDV